MSEPENQANSESTINEPREPTLSEINDELNRSYLRSLLNQHLKIDLSDGRVVIGQLLCTDRDENLIMGGCSEYTWFPSEQIENLDDHDSIDRLETRRIGLVVVPGRHVRRLSVGQFKQFQTFTDNSKSE